MVEKEDVSDHASDEATAWPGHWAAARDIKFEHFVKKVGVL